MNTQLNTLTPRDMEIAVPTVSPEQQMAAIRKALSPEESSDEEEEEASQETKNEVLYNQGATPLFMAIEEMDWRRALHCIQENPETAKTWVVSTGTVQTTFDWSLWRRLPLHEACRRQAPAWLVSALLSVYPESAREKTQFDELPLHLAVECGAAPEVVNLLLVSNWHGIAAADRSGRTPREILNDSEMLAMEDHKVVYDSLTRSQREYEQILADHAKEIKTLKVEHAAGLVAIRSQHDDDLNLEQEQQEKLLNEVERLKKLLNASKQREQQLEGKIDQCIENEAAWSRKVELLQESVADRVTERENETKKVFALEKIIRARDDKVASLLGRIEDLSGDLRMVSAWREKELKRHMDKSHRYLQKFVDSFAGLHEIMADHSNGMREMLEARGIDWVDTPPAPVVAKDDEKKESSCTGNERISYSDEEEILAEDAMDSAAAAATAALQLDS